MVKCTGALTAVAVLLFLMSMERIEAHIRHQQKPNIIFIMADDLGWNDVGFHNAKVRTPNIDRLASMGIELTQHYVQPTCSPSRASLMTGKYASNTGFQQMVLDEGAKSCLPIEHKLMSEFMKDRGYATKYVGKWHLGSCNTSCLPTYRGFDEYRGVIFGTSDYYTWEYNGVMYRLINDKASTANVGRHLTIKDGMDVTEMIGSHNTTTPLFMVISPTAPHTPLQVTDEMFNVHDFLSDTNNITRKRREYLGLVSALDDVVGVTIDILTERNMLQNSIIIFTSDNGGTSIPIPLPGFDAFASNYPLRHSKTSFHEGGVRVPTIYFDPKLDVRTRGTKRDFLMHVSDWLPTFIALGGRPLNFREKEDLDGINQISNLRNKRRHQYSVRDEMLVGFTNLRAGIFDETACSNSDGSYRWKDWKLLYGNKTAIFPPVPGVSEWQVPIESPEFPVMTGDPCVRVDEHGNNLVECLFNIESDPYEQHNIFRQNPKLVRFLLRKLQKADRKGVKNMFKVGNPSSPENSQQFGDYLIIRSDYCEPDVDFPLIPQPEMCLLNF